MQRSGVERQLALPFFIREHATTMTLRTTLNPLDRAVYQRGRVLGVRDGDGITEHIRCNCCGLLLPAKPYNFRVDSRNKSGFEHVCVDCRNSKRRTYRKQYMRSYREGAKRGGVGHRDVTRKIRS